MQSKTKTWNGAFHVFFILPLIQLLPKDAVAHHYGIPAAAPLSDHGLHGAQLQKNNEALYKHSQCCHSPNFSSLTIPSMTLLE